MRSLVFPNGPKTSGLQHCATRCPTLPMEKGGWEGGMLLQFCHYHIQNYRSYKQGEQEANLRTNQNSSGGSGKRQEPPGRGVGGGLLWWHCGLTHPTPPCCWTPSQPPHPVAEFSPGAGWKGKMWS